MGFPRLSRLRNDCRCPRQVSRARDLIARCPAPDGLTVREAEVLQVLAMRRTNRAIAVALHVSVHTIERHLQSAYRKIGVRNRADAAAHMGRIGS